MVVVQGEAEMDEDLQGLVDQDDAEAPTIHPRAAMEKAPGTELPAGALDTLPKAVNYIPDSMFIAAGGSSGNTVKPGPAEKHSGSSLADLIRRTKDEHLTRLQEVYGKAADGFSKGDPDVLQDAVTMLVHGEWVRDDSRLRNLLYLALPVLDPGHFKFDDNTIKLTETRILCRALTGALLRNFKSKQVPADKLRDSNPYTSSKVSPVPFKKP